MKQKFKGWSAVAECLNEQADDQQKLANEKKGEDSARLNPGQRASLREIATRIVDNGVLIADEVGMGKTRIAVEVARAVSESGGRVAILIPPGLGYQWQAELRDGRIYDVKPVLRSLQAYFKAWADDERENGKPWFDQSVVLMSHAFANLRFRGHGDSWRWALLPDLYAQWRKARDGRLSRDYHNPVVEWSNGRVRTAADSICSCVFKCAKKHPIRRKLDDLVDKHVGLWPHTLLDGNAYLNNATLRIWLEHGIGFGLGVFDLIIIDEAHKSRREESGLSRLLDNVIFPSSAGRRLALTATPVELDASQWTNTLKRLSLDEGQLRSIDDAVSRYVTAVKQVQQTWRTSDESRQQYKDTASHFQKALSRYLLRRDKREDPAVKLFEEYTKLPINEYRRECEIAIDTSGLSPSWKKAICAAESLSFVTRLSDSPEAKRLRLTFGNGHGIAAWLDQIKSDDDDQEQEGTGEAQQDGRKYNDEIGSPDSKRQARATWWLDVVKQAFSKDDTSLYTHPAILAAVAAIENATRNAEKVLVFGRFTRPMRALVDLLNAQEMLRRLRNHEPWPQSQISTNSSDWKAIQAVCREGDWRPSRRELNEELKANYVHDSDRREKFRENLVSQIEKGLSEIAASRSRQSQSKIAANQNIGVIFDAFKRAVQSGSLQAGQENRPLVLLARAIGELIGQTEHSPTALIIATAFCELIQAARDRDDAENDSEPNDDEASELWETLEQRLSEEYGGRQGGFARLMFGETRPESRRMIQLAFNRPNSFPRVLVAQSIVGREGLNLHESCRIVVMLHPEWNPGVVEQQIGRVDRFNSRWCKELHKAIEAGKPADQLPRIEVRPVIFKGTYDEHNWKVLRMRWDELRSQLHGIVISPKDVADNQEQQELLDELRAAAPNFSPTHNTKLSHLIGNLE